jgi:penicillin-binding protein 2
MTELKDLEQELDRFRGRVLVAPRLRAALLRRCWRAHGVPAGLRHDELATQAEANRIAVVPSCPTAA